MLLYILRHGTAEERGPDWPDDAMRPLTAEGKQKTRDAARGLRALEPAIGIVLTSPFTRAKQTARLLADELGIDPTRVKETMALAAGADPEAIWRAVREAGRSSGVLLVGHEPDLGRLVSWLISGDTRASIPLKKAGLACVELEAGETGPRGSLRFLLTPAQLRALAR